MRSTHAWGRFGKSKRNQSCVPRPKNMALFVLWLNLRRKRSKQVLNQAPKWSGCGSLTPFRSLQSPPFSTPVARANAMSGKPNFMELDEQTHGCGSKIRNSTMGCPIGKWKHGPKPAVCPPSWLILSHKHTTKHNRQTDRPPHYHDERR